MSVWFLHGHLNLDRAFQARWAAWEEQWVPWLVAMGALGGGSGVSHSTSPPGCGLPTSVDADVGQRFDFLLPGQG